MTPRLLAAVAAGGALGAVLRWACGELLPDGGGLPATTLAVNVVGTVLLALLPLVPAVRRSAALAAAAGPGLLGGFTTLSAVSEQTRSLLDGGRPLLAGAHLVGTLAACLLGIALAGRLTGRLAARAEARA